MPIEYFLHIYKNFLTMKNFILLMILVIAGFGATSCKKIDGSGGIVYENRSVTGFSGISLSMDATVYYQKDTGYSITLSGQQNILDVIQTNLQNGTLVIQYKNDVTIGSHMPITITVSAPDVNALTISGSGDIQMLGSWEIYSATATISGSGNISLYGIHAHDLAANISGSGNVEINGGTARNENLNISGSGTINLQYVQADTVYATVSGSGNILVSVTDLLDATISGSGNIKYAGNPVVNTHISGSGSVVHL
jgi:hypothetical protein